VGNALAASDRLNAVVVLKGHSTIVADRTAASGSLTVETPRLPRAVPEMCWPGSLLREWPGVFPLSKQPCSGSLCTPTWVPLLRAVGVGSSPRISCPLFPAFSGNEAARYQDQKGAIVYDDTAAKDASELPRPALPGSRPLTSPRRKRRGGRLTYFPLVIIAIGLFILFRIVPNTPVSRATLSGWQVTLHVTPYQDTLIVGVTFLSGTPGRVPGEGSPEGPGFPGAACACLSPARVGRRLLQGTS